MTLKDFIDAIQKVCTGGASVVAAGVALKGYNKWFFEHRGKEHFQAAKNALAACYRVRDGIEAGRGQLNHFSRRPDIQSSLNSVNFRDALLRRDEPIREALNALYPFRVEAEALFGKEAGDAIDRLVDYADMFRFAIGRLLSETPNGPRSLEDRTLRQHWNITVGIHPRPSTCAGCQEFEDDNGFEEGFRTAVASVEDYFKKILGSVTSQ